MYIYYINEKAIECSGLISSITISEEENLSCQAGYRLCYGRWLYESRAEIVSYFPCNNVITSKTVLPCVNKQDVLDKTSK